MSGLLSRDVLEYDTDNLRAQAEALRQVIKGLQDDSEDLRNSLEDLKASWDTTAGKTFFEKYDKLWLDQISDYTALLEDLRCALKYAADQYDPLTEEFNRIG